MMANVRKATVFFFFFVEIVSGLFLMILPYHVINCTQRCQSHVTLLYLFPSFITTCNIQAAYS